MTRGWCARLSGLAGMRRSGLEVEQMSGSGTSPLGQEVLSGLQAAQTVGGTRSHPYWFSGFGGAGLSKLPVVEFGSLSAISPTTAYVYNMT